MRNAKTTKYSEHPSAMGDYWNGTSLEEDEVETLTIDAYTYEDLKDPDGHVTEKIVVHFKEDTRGLTLNKTRGAALVKAFGDDMEGWIGERVELFVVETQMGAGIRIRAAKSKKTGARPDRDAEDSRPAKKLPAKSRSPEDEDEDDDDDLVEDVRPARAAKSRR